MDEKERALRAELADLDTRLQDPAIYADKGYPKLAKRKAQLDDLIALFDEKNRLLTDKESAEALRGSPDKDMAEMAAAELEDLEKKIAANDERLIGVLTPADPNNDRDVIMEIRAAAGGDESS